VQLNAPFWGEHGLAYLIETTEGRLLFDTGQSGTVLLHNLQVLGIDPSTIDALALSHAHYDHTGGLPALLEHLRPGIPLYANADLFRERFSRRGDRTASIGLALTRAELAARLTLKLDTSPQQIFAGVWTTGQITARPEFQGGSDALLMRQGDGLAADTYQDDMALVLQDGDSLMLLCGCCHAGLLNTLAHVQQAFHAPVSRIAGGLHLASVSADDLHHCGHTLAGLPALQCLQPGHCTGEAAVRALAQVLGPERVGRAPAATVIELGS
jgi:7,8-dihydropterin-6-yl-methyl-4-(beta-D-ribofuranosyl)aminobenzene 5'-phosphate synthase